MKHRIVRSPKEDDRLAKLLDDGWVVNHIDRAILRRPRVVVAFKQVPSSTGLEHVLDDEICEYLIVLERSALGRVK